jgi:hypothetical protein
MGGGAIQKQDEAQRRLVQRLILAAAGDCFGTTLLGG